MLFLKYLIVLHVNIGLTNKSHGPVHYQTGVTCVYNGHLLHT